MDLASEHFVERYCHGILMAEQRAAAETPSSAAAADVPLLFSDLITHSEEPRWVPARRLSRRVVTPKKRENADATEKRTAMRTAFGDTSITQPRTRRRQNDAPRPEQNAAPPRRGEHQPDYARKSS